jgi:hypothetical protein
MNGIDSRKTTRSIAFATAAALCLTSLVPALAALQQTTFGHEALDARLPVVREHRYVVNARIRPFLLFWIGRDDVGGARITWRRAAGGSRAFELLIGSDPTRAPRGINRWGYIVEELRGDEAEVLGVMKESNEQTLEEARTEVEQKREVSVFKAARATVTGNHAVSGTMTVYAPAHLTFRELDALLALMPDKPPTRRTMELPSGTLPGFLVAMETLFHESLGRCEQAGDSRVRNVSTLPYVYGQTLYDLTLASCTHEPTLQIGERTLADVIDGRFQVKNRTTKRETEFRVHFGASGNLRGVPVRVLFRPRWWMEVELVLDHPSSGEPGEATVREEQ